jgi:hypothetical protein
MPEQEDYKLGDITRQSKLYDKIVKENMQKVLPTLVKDILGINIISRADLPESIQHTKETVPDQLSKVTDDTGKTYILHIEWQSEDDLNMDNRMLSYRVMLRRKYQLPVKQYVIFLARPKSAMPYAINEAHLQFQYHLIALQQYSHKIFLNSSVPEQKLMAIFGNFENEAPVVVIKKILHGIEEQGDGALSKSRYREQLRGLIQLRKLGKEFKIAMGTITKFKVEKDPFYQDGVKKGIEKGEAGKSHDVVENLIIKLGLSDEQAADVAEVTIAFVKKVRKELEARK